MRLAADDLGAAGHTSLAYLRRFPLNVLNVDKVFVDRVARGVPDATLARTVVALGLRTVAEGVKVEAQCAAPAALGCPLG